MKNADAICLVLTSWPADADPAPFARDLVEARLAACVHVFGPGVSVYRWRGAVEVADERQLVIKTTHGALPALEVRVRARHPYEVPEWLVLDAGSDAAYGGWLREAIGPEA